MKSGTCAQWEWGRLYEEYHQTDHNPAKVDAEVQKSGKSNWPLCSVGHDANKVNIWAIDAMDADHVAAWSKGGSTSASNCEILCRTHNQAKGNK